MSDFLRSLEFQEKTAVFVVPSGTVGESFAPVGIAKRMKTRKTAG